jgi:hypothetical protein
MDPTIHRTSSINPPVLTAGPSGNDTIQANSASFEKNCTSGPLHSQQHGGSFSNLPTTSISPKFSTGISPAFTANYQDDYQYKQYPISPLFYDSDIGSCYEGHVEFESSLSPIVSAKISQEQYVTTKVPYDQFLQNYAAMNNRYQQEIQATLFDHWSFETIQQDINKSNCVLEFSPLPAVPFNGDPSLLVIDKSKVTELNTAQHTGAPTENSYKSNDCENTELSKFDYRSDQNGVGGIDSESEYEPDSVDLFPPLPQDQEEIHGKLHYHVIKRAFGETDSPISVLADDVDSDFSDMSDKEPHYNEEDVTEPASIVRGALKRKAPTFDDDDYHDQDEYDSDNYQEGSNNRRKKVSHSQSAKKQPSDSKPYECFHCSYESRRRYNLTTHMLAHDSIRVKGFKCPVCGKIFNRKYDKNRHVATVHKKKKGLPMSILPCTV